MEENNENGMNDQVLVGDEKPSYNLEDIDLDYEAPKEQDPKVLVDPETLDKIVEQEKSLSEIHAKEQAEKEEKSREEQKIKKVKVPGQLDHSHPLMTCEMNLLEISHRTIEIVEKYKLNLIGSSEGSYEDDVKKFKDFLFDTLVKLKK